jgi:soluble lytic murein transglycosylase-like protein
MLNSYAQLRDVCTEPQSRRIERRAMRRVGGLLSGIGDAGARADLHVARCERTFGHSPTVRPAASSRRPSFHRPRRCERGLATPRRGVEYDELIAEHARLNGVRTDLVRAVVQVESAFNPYAKSIKGALGLMQLMPATIRQFGVTDPFNPVQNIRAGVAYLRQLLDRYGNDEQLALAAYNAGPGAVDRHGQSIPPYLETQHYVDRINGLAAAPPMPPRDRAIYKSTDIVDGREVPRFSDTKPSTGAYEVVGR